MKSKLIIAVLFVTLVACNYERSRDLAEYNLKGKVKSVRGIKYKAIEKFGKTEKGSRTSRDTNNELDLYLANSKMLFNEEGLLSAISLFDKRGDLGFKMVHEDTVIDIYTAKGSLLGKMIGDDKFTPKEMKMYDQEGKFQSKIVMAYDENDNLKEEKEYNRKGKLIASSTSDYNQDNQVIRKVKFETKRKRSYYEDKTDSVKTVYTFTYNENGDVALMQSQTWIIDGDNEREDSIAPARQYEYTYDEQNNWIVRIESENEIPQSLIEREIEYYE